MRKMKLLTLALFLAFSLILMACGSQTAASTDTAAHQTEPAKETSSVQPENISPAPEQTSDPAADSENTDAAPSEEPAADPADASEEQDPVEAEPQDEVPEPHSEILVAVFSATGTTKGVAEKIAAIENADLYEIIPAEPYSDADLNYNDRNSRSTKEQNDKSVRPVIGSEPIDLSGYTTIYIGFPIWWGEEPRIMDTFVESYDFTGITLIPFCTSASSGIGRSGSNMESLAGSGTWLAGRRFPGSVSETELQSWISGLK